MTSPPPKNPARHLRTSDIRGIAQLATHATVGVARIAEGVHHSVTSTIGLDDAKKRGRTGGLTGVLYKSVRGAATLLGKGLEAVLATLEPFFDSAENAGPGSPEREAVLAALNGVMGDHLAANGNPFATPMTLRYRGEALDWQAVPPPPDAKRKVLLLVHGLCMNDLKWHTSDEGKVVDHGEALAAALGATPLYLRYNSGLHISENGRALSARLEQLVLHWPAPLEELTVVAHSMGGLVIRSAFHYAKKERLQWPARLKSIVFLGTPHHGAPLERAGNWIDTLLGSTPYTAPFARLGQLRSAGITDLRYGHVLDEDWKGHDRFQRKPDNRAIVPLPEGVACYAIAATTAAKRGLLADRLVGDGLVPLNSALGRHADARRNLDFAKQSEWIAYRTSHLGLLGSPEVTRRMLQWLAPSRAAAVEA